MSPGSGWAERFPSRGLTLVSVALAVFAYRELLVWEPMAVPLPHLEVWLYAPSGTSPQLVLVLAGTALLARWGRLREARGTPVAWSASAPLLALGGLLFVWGTYVGAGDLLLASLVVLVLWVAAWSGGATVLPPLLLPLGIALFAIPLPAVLSNQLTFPLQLLVAEHTVALLGVLGFPAERSGDLIFTPTATVQVIESCSGIRSMDVLTLLALVFVAWFHTGWKRGAVLVLAAPCIAHGVNVARVAWIVVHARGQVAPPSHVEEGLVVFGAGVALLVALDLLLSRLLPGSAAEVAVPRRSSPGPEPLAGWRRSAVALVAGALALASVVVPRWSPTDPAGPPIELPEEVGGWRRAELEGPIWTAGDVGHAAARYTRGDEAVVLFLARDDRLRRSISLLSPRNLVPGPGWEVRGRWREGSGGSEPELHAVLAESLASRSLTYTGFENVGGLLEEVVRALLATDRSFLRRPREARILRVTTVVAPRADGRAEAEARLEGFLGAWRSRSGAS